MTDDTENNDEQTVEDVEQLGDIEAIIDAAKTDQEEETNDEITDQALQTKVRLAPADANRSCANFFMLISQTLASRPGLEICQLREFEAVALGEAMAKCLEKWLPPMDVGPEAEFVSTAGTIVADRYLILKKIAKEQSEPDGHARESQPAE
ncbi:MAG: hypothetical protein COA96_14145 [SAR86 cluster bacterium]|uniref:Uncharacterized protein n=1 Tax=SAR86 cluster bacterium TaxID=2030880 RepID=A0A2A5AUI3_9GAMM|nr:MAG: hypothetical protein COA96_14145 [SAR86 cluster bacterium]